MKRQRHSPEQIVRKLRTAGQMLSEGKAAGEAAKDNIDAIFPSELGGRCR